MMICCKEMMGIMDREGIVKIRRVSDK